MYRRSDRDWGLADPPPAGGVSAYQCSTNAITLDDFLVGDYRIRTSHYDKLMHIKDAAAPHLSKGTPLALFLTGHTDRSGAEKMNHGLSLARAIEVKKWLVGVGLPVLDVEGKGESSPVDPANNETAFRKNRRVEIRVCLPKSFVQPVPIAWPPGRRL